MGIVIVTDGQRRPDGHRRAPGVIRYPDGHHRRAASKAWSGTPMAVDACAARAGALMATTGVGGVIRNAEGHRGGA